MFVVTIAYCDKCEYGGVTAYNLVYCDKPNCFLQAKLCTMCSEVCKCCTKITCNHPKICMINPGFPLATFVPCPSPRCCAAYMFVNLFVWMGKIS